MPITSQAKSKTKKEETAKIAKKEAAVVAAEAPVENTGDQEFGKDAVKISFVAPLGDPSQDDVTYIPSADGKPEKKVDPVIVGYRFVASVDLEVPDVAPGDDFKKNLMSFTGDTNKTRTVKAGTEFDLTRFETGMLLSRPEYNGRAEGGQIKVACAYSNKSKKTADGTVVATTAAETAIPKVVLRAVGKNVSIKDVPMIPVLEFTKAYNEQAKQTRKTRKILPGFEKWEPLCKNLTPVRSSSAGSSASTANKRNPLAEAFLRVATAQGQKK